MPDRTAKHPVKAAKKTFGIIEALRELNGAGVTELANHVGTPKSNVHNYLSTLEEIGYVIKDDDNYHLSLQFLGLGAFARQRYHVNEVSKPELDELVRETGELVNLLVEEHGKGVYLYRETGEKAVNVDAYLGYTVSLHNTALGKAIMAHLPSEKVDEIIAEHGLPGTTEYTITDRETLEREFKEIRAEGVAYDREERIPGLRCLAAPIIDATGTVQAAISISGPKSRMSDDRFHETLPNKLRDTANIIELNSSYM